MKKNILIFTVVALLLFLIIPFFSVPLHLGNIKNAGGWSVGLAKLDTGNFSFPYLKNLIADKRFVVIPNDNRDFKGKIEFNADPFLFENNDSLYLFVETKPLKQKAHISVYLVNKNNLNPEYLGIAAIESFHLSYPAIHKFRNQIFMIPESQKSGLSVVYKAIDFPLKWVICDTLFDFQVKDPTLSFINDSTGYIYFCEKMMLYKSKFTICDGHLNTSDKIFVRCGPNSRPGGSVTFIEGDTFLFLQNNFFGYGSGLDAYSIRNNSIQSFLIAHENFSPFSAGMHHFNSAVSGDKVYLSFDGNKLIDKNMKRNMKHALKINYLTIWNFWFPKLEPIYPFNY